MVRGITLLCQHLQDIPKGIRNDYPPAMYYQQPLMTINSLMMPCQVAYAYGGVALRYPVYSSLSPQLGLLDNDRTRDRKRHQRSESCKRPGGKHTLSYG